MMKFRWISDTKDMEGIDNIFAVTKVLAVTTNFGKVDVEFTLEASFTINGYRVTRQHFPGRFFPGKFCL